MSGFLWRHNNEAFLVTNWHNVTGINPNTGAAIGSFSPSHMSCALRCLVDNGIASVFIKTELALYDADLIPIWIEHPTGKSVDVVIVPFKCDLPDGHQLVFLNEQDFITEWFPEVGDEAFVIGYPEGVSGARNTPIWKRASIASEPKLDYENQPLFLVDTIGNQGLSGSAVVGRSSGLYGKAENGLDDNTILGTWENFIGVYSGRVANEGIGSQLGRVWKASVLHEIFTENF